VFDVGEDVFHRSRDDTRLVLVSRLERGGKVNTAIGLHGKRKKIELTRVNVFPEAVCP